MHCRCHTSSTALSEHAGAQAQQLSVATRRQCMQDAYLLCVLAGIRNGAPARAGRSRIVFIRLQIFQSFQNTLHTCLNRRPQKRARAAKTGASAQERKEPHLQGCACRRARENAVLVSYFGDARASTLRGTAVEIAIPSFEDVARRCGILQV